MIVFLLLCSILAMPVESALTVGEAKEDDLEEEKSEKDSSDDGVEGIVSS